MHSLNEIYHENQVEYPSLKELHQIAEEKFLRNIHHWRNREDAFQRGRKYLYLRSLGFTFEEIGQIYHFSKTRIQQLTLRYQEWLKMAWVIWYRNYLREIKYEENS